MGIPLRGWMPEVPWGWAASALPSRDCSGRHRSRPAGREDCLLELRVEDGSAARAEALLRAVHGMEVFAVDEM